MSGYEDNYCVFVIEYYTFSNKTWKGALDCRWCHTGVVQCLNVKVIITAEDWRASSCNEQRGMLPKPAKKRTVKRYKHFWSATMALHVASVYFGCHTLTHTRQECGLDARPNTHQNRHWRERYLLGGHCVVHSLSAYRPDRTVRITARVK